MSAQRTVRNGMIQPGPAGAPHGSGRGHPPTGRAPAARRNLSPPAPRRRILRTALVLLLSPAACRAAAQLPPVTLDQVEELIGSKVPAARIDSIARNRCFAFTWAEEAQTRLRAAGATGADLAVVQSTCKRLPPPTFSGSPTPPRPEIGLLGPRTAVYRFRGRADSVVQWITLDARDGHRVARFRAHRAGAGTSVVSETVIDALSFAPVSYTRLATSGGRTSRVVLRRVDDRVTGVWQDYGRPAYAVRHNAHQGTLLPGMPELVLLASGELSTGRTFVLSTFTEDTADPCLLTMVVERETVVTVPAGTFASWQLRASGSGCGRPVRLYVNKDPIAGYPPRVILAMEGSGERLELLRARQN